MDLAKHYIVQCINTAANNLRLSSAKIEMVAILKEFFEKCDNLDEEINRMKHITEFSKFAIRLSQVHNTLVNNRIDFLKISEKFKEDSYSLVKEFSNMLDLLTPELTKKKLYPGREQGISIDLSKRTTDADALVNDSYVANRMNGETQSDDHKNDTATNDKYLFDEPEEETDFDFDRFEETILKEIKYLDSFLNRLINYDYETGELLEYVKLMKTNSELSQKVGFEILYNMHKVFYRALELVHSKQIIPSEDVIESMRSCLIVIVAVVRDKDVDISTYLKKAEVFGRKILSKKREE